MDQRFSIVGAIQDFESAVLSDVLNRLELDSFATKDDPSAEDNVLASRNQSIESATCLFKICAVRSARGRTGIDRSSNAMLHPSMPELLDTLMHHAQAEMAQEEAMLERCDVLDLDDEIFKDLLDDCIADFELHVHNVCLAEVKRAGANARVDSPQLQKLHTELSKAPLDVLSAVSADVKPDTRSFDRELCAQQSASPAQLLEPSLDRFESTHVFTYINWFGKSSSSDYSAAYRTPAHMRAAAPAPCTLPERQAPMETQPQILQDSIAETAPDTQHGAKDAEDAQPEARSEIEEDIASQRESVVVLVHEQNKLPTSTSERLPFNRKIEQTMAASLLDINSSTTQEEQPHEDAIATMEPPSQSQELEPVRSLSVTAPLPRDVKDAYMTVPHPPQMTVPIAYPTMPNLAMVQQVFGEKKRKGERKYKSLPALPLAFTISIKTTSRKPTIVLLLDQEAHIVSKNTLSMAISNEALTDAIGESVLIVRFPMSSAIFPDLPIAEGKVEFRIESVAHMINVALDMKSAAKKSWPEVQEKWQWKTDDCSTVNKPVYRRITGAAEVAHVKDDFGFLQKFPHWSQSWLTWELLCWIFQLLERH